MPAVSQTSEAPERGLPEQEEGGVYLRPCDPTPGETLTFDLVDVLFRGKPDRRRVRLQQAVLERWAEKNAPAFVERLAGLAACLRAPRMALCGVPLERPRIMGIVNVTPDSFSDGGDHADPSDAIAHGCTLAKMGADFIDVGGESTRPRASSISEDEERRRVVPVVRALSESGLVVSIDTRRASVMAAALDAGAQIVNDVSALTHDPGALALVAERNATVVLMHMQGAPSTMQKAPHYDDASLDVFDVLQARVSRAVAAGIPRAKIVVDPGIGFGKTAEHNFEILRDIALFHGLGCALLVGVSRKAFVARTSVGEPPKERLPGSLAAGLHVLDEGAHILRVHDVAETRQALAIWQAIRTPSAARAAPTC